MDAISKAADQELFRSLMTKLEKRGLCSADVARLLNKTPGAVSQYLSGYTTPSKTVLELMRRIVAERPAKKLSAQMSEVIQKLADIKRDAPGKFRGIVASINFAHREIQGFNIESAIAGNSTEGKEKTQRPSARARRKSLRLMLGLNKTKALG